VPDLVPPRAPLPSTAPDDPRVGHLLGRGLGSGEAPRAVLVGFPTDVGVSRNGGRPGAAEGPGAIRRLLYRLTPDAGAPERFTALLGKTLDAGDLAVSRDLERDLSEFVAEMGIESPDEALASYLTGTQAFSMQFREQMIERLTELLVELTQVVSAAEGDGGDTDVSCHRVES